MLLMSQDHRVVFPSFSSCRCSDMNRVWVMWSAWDTWLRLGLCTGEVSPWQGHPHKLAARTIEEIVCKETRTMSPEEVVWQDHHNIDLENK